MDTVRIGEFLLKLRKQKNLTQKDISNICNVSTQAVSKWERGESIPDIELLERLSILYGISIKEIINGEEKVLYLDIDKRNNVISLVISILVLIALFFPYAQVQTNITGFNETMIFSGFKLVFNGISGIFVYLTWFIFSILVSHVIINIFVILKIVEQHGIARKYMIISCIPLIIVTFFSIFAKELFIFPQLIILICSLILFIVNINNLPEHSVIYNMNLYYKNRESLENQEEYKLNQDIKSSLTYKISKIFYYITILILSFELIILFTSIKERLLSEYSNDLYFYVPMLILVLISIVILIILTKLLNTKYAKHILFIGCIFSLLPSLSLMFDSLLNEATDISAYTGALYLLVIPIINSIFILRYKRIQKNLNLEKI